MSSEAPSDSLRAKWILEQHKIAAQVITHDENDWASFFDSSQFMPTRDLFIAGTDISFSTLHKDHAIGSLTVFSLRKTGAVDLLYSNSRKVEVKHPYLPTFLGFREAPVVSTLLRALPCPVRQRLDCLLLDGNGLLHPRKAGLACQVGVREDIATVGVSKSLLCLDGLDEREMRHLTSVGPKEGVDVRGQSGFVWAKAVLTGNAQSKPIYVSVGHKVSLNTASHLVRRLCEFRVPAPIRAADLHSRALFRGEEISIYEPQEFSGQVTP